MRAEEWSGMESRTSVYSQSCFPPRKVVCCAYWTGVAKNWGLVAKVYSHDAALTNAKALESHIARDSFPFQIHRGPFNENHFPGSRIAGEFDRRTDWFSKLSS